MFDVVINMYILLSFWCIVIFHFICDTFTNLDTFYM
jgi:hypothetical protein